MSKKSICRFNNHIVVTYGNMVRRFIIPTISAAIGLEARLTSDDQFAERWMLKKTGAQSQVINIIPIIRKHKVIIAFDNEGNVLRTYQCRNLQCAVDLETKLNSDVKLLKFG